MPSSVYNSILTAVQSVINSLGLTDWNSASVPNAIRKLPKAEETIDALPLIAIVPDDKSPDRKPFAFVSGTPIYRMAYPVGIAFIAAGSGDYTAHLDTYAAWHQSVTNAFKVASVLSLTPPVWDINVHPELLIDRGETGQLYDIGGLSIEVITAE